MLIQAVAGLISLFALLVGLAVGSAFLGYAYLAALLATYCTVAICIALYVSSLKPTQSLLQADLRRLANVVKVRPVWPRGNTGFKNARRTLGWYRNAPQQQVHQAT